MSKITIDVDIDLLRKARSITGLRTEQEIVSKAVELLVRSENRKNILRYYGSGIWKGDLKKMRRKH